MKCQILFFRKSKKNIISLSSADFAHCVINVKLSKQNGYTLRRQV